MPAEPTEEIYEIN